MLNILERETINLLRTWNEVRDPKIKGLAAANYPSQGLSFFGEVKPHMPSTIQLQIIQDR